MIELVALICGLLLFGAGYRTCLEVYKQKFNRIRNLSRLLPSNKACWEDSQGNQWLIFILPDDEVYMYCNGQAVGIHGDQTVKLNVERKW